MSKKWEVVVALIIISAACDQTKSGDGVKAGAGVSGIAALTETAATPVAAATNLNSSRSNRHQGNSPPRLGLEIDGAFVAWLDTVEGMHFDARLYAPGATHWGSASKKGPGHVKSEDLSLTVNSPASEDLYRWLQSGVVGNAGGANTRKNGAIIAADFNRRELARVEFTDALITEVSIPALDAASKDAAKFVLTIQPESTRQVRGSGEALDTNRQKKWLPANFRLEVVGLDECGDAASRAACDAMCRDEYQGNSGAIQACIRGCGAGGAATPAGN